MSTSIIIPLHNPGELLLPTLQRLVATTPEEAYEAVFVDCASDDGTPELLAQITDGAEVMSAPKSVGIAACVNRVLETTDSDFLVVAPVGIAYYPNWLNDLLGALESSPYATLQSSAGLEFVGI